MGADWNTRLGVAATEARFLLPGLAGLRYVLESTVHVGTLTYSGSGPRIGNPVPLALPRSARAISKRSQRPRDPEAVSFCPAVSNKSQPVGVERLMLLGGANQRGLKDAHLFHSCDRRHHGGGGTWRLLLAPPAGGSNATSKIIELLSHFAVASPAPPGRGFFFVNGTLPEALS